MIILKKQALKEIRILIKKFQVLNGIIEDNDKENQKNSITISLLSDRENYDGIIEINADSKKKKSDESVLCSESTLLAESFIASLHGENSLWYRKFSEAAGNTDRIYGILKALKHEISYGKVNFQQVVRAELFSDFLEMAKHLLDKGYKDPAAVMIGGVLEQQLRKLCLKNQILIDFTDAKGKLRQKKLKV